MPANTLTEGHTKSLYQYCYLHSCDTSTSDANQPSPCSASYVGYKRDTARICCSTPCCWTPSIDLSPAGPTAANLPHAAAATQHGTDRRTNERTSYRYIPCRILYERRAVPIIEQSTDYYTKQLAYSSSSSDFDRVLFCDFKTVGESCSSWAEVLASEFVAANGLLSPGCGLGVFLLPSACRVPVSSSSGGNCGVDVLARRCLDDVWLFGEVNREPSFEWPMFLKKFAMDFPIPLLCGVTLPFSCTHS